MASKNRPGERFRVKSVMLPGQTPENRNGLLFPESVENPWVTAPREIRLPGIGPTTLELCAGAGGQALGLEQAGIDHACLVELNPDACRTLRLNRPHWTVVETDLNHFDGARFRGVEMISGGLPCPPFSIAGKQLGEKDERNLFPSMIRLVDQVRPEAGNSAAGRQLLTSRLEMLFPPPFAKAVAEYIPSCLSSKCLVEVD